MTTMGVERSYIDHFGVWSRMLTERWLGKKEVDGHLRKFPSVPP